MGSDESSRDLGPLGSETARYDASWLKKSGFEKKLATLFVLRGNDAGLRIPLTKPAVTLGRTLDADLVFQDEQISRRHAMIVRDEKSDAYHLVDLGSTNGTYLNEERVEKAQLKDGDKIFIGGTILKFMLEDEVETESGELFDRLIFQDDLTGLVVKRRFYKDLEIRLLAAGVQRSPVSVLMMDMDGLKKVNDAHGHAMGAFVIAEVGKLLGEICRDKGQACRYGGDEFIAYLGNASKEEAVEFGRKICEAVRGHAFAREGVAVRVSISVGVASYPEDGKTLDAVVRAADEALYRAKDKGRDTVSV